MKLCLILSLYVCVYIRESMKPYLNLDFNTPNALSMVFLVLQCELLYLSSLLVAGSNIGVKSQGLQGYLFEMIIIIIIIIIIILLLLILILIIY